MKARLTLGTIGLTLLLAACGQPQGATDAPTASRPARTEAPLLGTQNPDAIAGQYVVVFSEGAMGNDLSAQDAGSLIRSLNLNAQGVEIQNIYAAALHGFSAKLSSENLAILRSDPRVKYVEQDAIMRMSATQTGATWGLDRIDQRNLPLDGSYTYNSTASGVKVYIIDTGINTAHSNFGGAPSGAPTPPVTATTATARATAPTSPAPSAAAPTASPRARPWSPSRFWTARAAAPTAASSPA